MAANDILAFLRAIDNELLHAANGETLDLYLIGRSALILGYGLQLMTKDVDVVEVKSSRLLAAAVEVFKKGGRGHIEQGFYLEAVSSGLPPLPGGFEKRCVDVTGLWRVIRPKRAVAHDLVISKLTRFHPGDREDVQILCDSGEVVIEILRERFKEPHNFSDMDDPKVSRASVNLEKVANYLQGRSRVL